MEQEKHQLHYQAQGGKFFMLEMKNFFLDLLTLGLYYPWAKASRLQFHFGKTRIGSDYFSFVGTGNEMFLGFIKGLILLLLFQACLLYGLFVQDQEIIFLGLGIFYLGMLFIIPFAIHGTLRYRAAKTSFRGIRFGYRGEMGQLVILLVKTFFLTIITLGIYFPWGYVAVRKYVFKHLRYGSGFFRFKGTGSDYFIIFLKGLFLIPLTLGIYSFWYHRNVYHFMVRNTEVKIGEEIASFETNVGASDMFLIWVMNAFLVPMTLGIAYPFIRVATLEILINSIHFSGVQLEQVTQTEVGYSDAAGEEIGDVMDLGFI